MFEKNNPTTALNVLYIKEKEICPAYISQINSNCEKQIILLMISDKEKEVQHYLAVQKLSALLHGICSKHLNCHHSFRTENKLKSHENVCKNQDSVKLPQQQKSHKAIQINTIH